ncbi:MAG: glycosyltransferase family 2 protein [Terracidiphilus sp.]|jgi:glycosyltransferase involved in cell wall biosynthesis
MKSLPKISVVLPSFNQAKYLELTLRSILDQQYPNLELIVIDGGSKDESPEIIRKYQEHMKFWCSEPDGGHPEGLIKGFSHATGEILCFLNSDDLFEPGVLNEVGEYFSAHPDVDVVYGDTTWIDAEGKPLRVHKEIPFNRFLWTYTYNYIPGMSTFWRRGIYDKVGGVTTTYRLAFDADLWIRFSHAGAKIRHVARQWSCMRFYPEQNNRRLRAQSDRDDIEIRSRYWKNHAVPKTYFLRRKIALGLRILWRLLTGCYGFGYQRHMEKLEKA